VDQDQSVSCKILLKCCLNALRSYTTVEWLLLKIDADQTLLTIELACRKGIRKLFDFSADEDVDENTPNVPTLPYNIQMNPRVLSEYVADFNSTTDEVTFIPQPETFKIRCHQDTKGAPAGSAVQTELKLDSSDFDVYHIAGDDTEFTFALRDLKALLKFCDFASQHVSVYYLKGGDPIVFKTDTSRGLFDAQFTLATQSSYAQQASDQGSADVPSQQHTDLPSRCGPSQTEDRGYDPTPSETQEQPPPARATSHSVRAPSQTEDRSYPQTSQARENPPPLRAAHSVRAPVQRAVSESRSLSQHPSQQQMSEENGAAQRGLEGLSGRAPEHDPSVVPNSRASSENVSAAPSAHNNAGDLREMVAGAAVDSEDEFVEGTPPPSPSARNISSSYAFLSQKQKLNRSVSY